MPDPQEKVLELTPAEFVKRLAPFERVLVELRDVLYEGSWEEVLADLRAQDTGQPYIYKFSKTIARDIAAIEKLRAYEQHRQVNLADLLKEGRA